MSVFLLGICSAMSTAGWILLGIVVMLFIYRKINSKLKYIYIFSLLATIVLAILLYDNIVLILLSVNYDFFSKFILDNASSVTRLTSPDYNLLIFLESPLWGSGYGEASVMYEAMLHGNIVAQTSTTTQMLSVFGILGAVPHVLPLVGVFSLQELSWFEKISIVCIILIILNKEPHTLILSTYIFLMYLCNVFIKRKRVE